MHRFLLLVVLFALSGLISACGGTQASQPPVPRADVYWAEIRSHIKIWNVEPAADGTWKITYDVDTDGPRYSSLTVPMERPPFLPGQRALMYGKMAQTGDVLITSLEEDPLAASPPATLNMAGPTEASTSPYASPGR